MPPSNVLTLGCLSLPDVQAPDLVDVADAGGFRSVGLRITGRYRNDPFLDVVGNPAVIADIRRRSAAHGVRISNISAYYMTPDVTIADLRPVVEASAALEAPMIVANRHDPDDARYFDNLAAYCETARGHGITLAIECMPYSEVKSLQRGLDILARANEPNLGLLLDPLHLIRCGNDYAEIAALDAQSIAFAQLCDAPFAKPADVVQEARTGRLLPGEGELPLDRFLDALPAQIELECEMPSAALAHLPPAERARRMHESASRFLADYASTRSARGR